MALHGVVLYDVALCCMALTGIALHSMMWPDMALHDVVWRCMTLVCFGLGGMILYDVA